MKFRKSILHFILSLCFLYFTPAATSSEILSEYRLKTAFLYNFIAYTEWPMSTEQSIHLCIYGENYFGDEINTLNGRMVNNQSILVIHKKHDANLNDCQVLFISSSEIENLKKILNLLNTQPTLTIADSASAASQGVTLNMQVENNKIAFEANIQAARHVGLTLSSKLLRLATKVYQ